MLSLTKLKKIIDHHFGPPFLPKRQVGARWVRTKNRTQVLEIKIGRRDVWLDANGELVGAGTALK